MLTLYPPIKPYNEFKLKVSAVHEIYVEESGNPRGLPVLFIHGGPGAGAHESDRCFFDPQKYRIIIFDQRGCGRSTPHACLEENTTQHLVADIETIRQHLAIERWVLFGGSWGSTLSIAYAEEYPERVIAMILRGIFLCTREEIAWFYGPNGAANIFPDYYAEFAAQLAEQDREDNYINAYYELLTSDDEAKRLAAAKAWSVWEGKACTLVPNAQKIDFFSNPYAALSVARIECHYFKNDIFLPLNQLLNNAHRLAAIPGIIVHGRYDMVCPPKTAWALHHAWPKSQLNYIPAAGHSSGEVGTVDALVRATQDIAKKFAA